MVLRYGKSYTNRRKEYCRKAINLGNYSDKVKDMVFSFSRCHSFENCKYEWYLNYLLKDEDGKRIYDNEQNFYAAFGHFCHELLEKYLKGDLSENRIAGYYERYYDNNVDSSEIGESTAEKYYELGLSYFEDMGFDWLDEYEILGVEEKCNFEIDGIKFVGFIDLLLKRKADGKIIIIDHKSAEYPLGKRGSVLKRKQESYEAYKRQLYLYSQHIINKYGEEPAELWWNYFKEKQWLKLPFIREEYEESLKWASETIREIDKEEDYLPNMDYFYCNNLCGFRHSCDYKLMGGD